MCVVLGLGPCAITHVYSSESSISLKVIRPVAKFCESLVLAAQSEAHVLDSNEGGGSGKGGIFTLCLVPKRTVPLLGLVEL